MKMFHIINSVVNLLKFQIKILVSYLCNTVTFEETFESLFPNIQFFYISNIV